MLHVGLSGPINILFYYISAVQLPMYYACLIKYLSSRGQGKKTEMVITVHEMDFEAVK